MNLNEKFNLNDSEKLLRLINRYVKPDFPNITFAIKKSDQSDSLYVICKLNSITTILRISDHDTNQNIKTTTVGKHTLNKKIVSSIIETAKSVHYKNLKEIFNNIKGNKEINSICNNYNE